MKSAGRLIDDSDLAAYMKQNGLGTAATRAETIEKLLKFNYLTRDKKTLRSTPKGQAFIEQLPSQLSDPLLTAEWEQHLKQIEDGEADAATLDAQLRNHITQAIGLIFSGRKIAASALDGDKAASLPLGPCPQCKEGHIKLRKGSKGAFYGCDRYKTDGTGCGFSLPGLYAGKKITPTTAKQLCGDKQKTSLIKGFKSAKTGKSYDGYLHLKNDNGRLRIEIIFASSKKQ
jgi:DNA topoisomerase-3